MKLLLILATLLFEVSVLQHQALVGTWVSEDDPNWQMVFTQDDCIWYYENEITDRYSYSLTNLSLQCGYDAPVDSTTLYLKLTSKADNGKPSRITVGTKSAAKNLLAMPQGQKKFQIFFLQIAGTKKHPLDKKYNIG